MHPAVRLHPLSPWAERHSAKIRIPSPALLTVLKLHCIARIDSCIAAEDAAAEAEDAEAAAEAVAEAGRPR